MLQNLFLRFELLLFCSKFTVVHTCTSDQIAGCKSGNHGCDGDKCIPIQYVCNEIKDCEDLTDEQGCGCEDDEFTCSNQECIPTDYKCNGFSDCTDSSDENLEICQSTVTHETLLHIILYLSVLL